jgi:hypothetical protein
VLFLWSLMRGHNFERGLEAFIQNVFLGEAIVQGSGKVEGWCGRNMAVAESSIDRGRWDGRILRWSLG